jgi:hypothetical protein
MRRNVGSKVKEQIGWQLVRVDGSVVHEGPFGDASSLREGVASVRVARWGMMTRAGAFVADPIYTMLWPAFHGRAGFVGRDGWGYLDTNGDVAIEPRFKEIRNFHREAGIAIVGNGKWGVIRRDGSFLVPAEMDGIGIGPDGWIRVFKNGLVGFVDASGNPVIDFKFRGADFFHFDRAVVNVDGKRGYIDRRGELVVPAIYDDAKDFHDGLALVKKDGRFGYIDVDGRSVMAIELDDGNAFDGGIAFVRRSSSDPYTCIDVHGKPAHDVRFGIAFAYEKGTAIVGAKSTGPFGIANARGELTLPMEYDHIDALVGSTRVIGKRNRNGTMTYGYADAAGKLACAPRFLKALAIEDELGAVQTMIEATTRSIVPRPPPIEEACVVLGARQLHARTALLARPALVDAILAAQDRGALRKSMKAKESHAELGKCAWFVLEALGVNAVAALEASIETMRTVSSHADIDWTCIEALDAIESFESACARARLFGEPKEPERNVARWLRALAAAGTDKAKQSFAALVADHPDALPALLATLPPDEAARVREIAASSGADLAEATTSELPAQLRTPAKAKLPEFWDARKLVRPRLAGGTKALPLAAVDEIAAHSEEGDLDVAALRAACDAHSLRDFAWSACALWLASNSPAKHKWALTMLGDFGDDDTVARLAPLVGEWPGQAAHARAVLGLGVLGKIGTDAALRAIHRLSQRAKFGGLKKEAQHEIDAIAKRRGLTSEELVDQLVPDFDLDDDGSRVLDFGARSFRVGFDEALKPFVTADGKRIAELPKPNASDDKARAAEAVAYWKSLKKEVRAIASLQIERLEHAMAAQRRWHFGAFRAHFVDHPLLVNLARRLVWSTYDATSASTQTFRIDESRKLADVREVAIELDAASLVGIAHPIDLGEDAITAWSKVFADYEIVQPFAQLGREVFALTKEEEASRKLDRCANVEVRGGALVGLTTRGWSRGSIEDNGIYYEIENAHATVAFKPGIAIGMGGAQPNQKIDDVTLKPSPIAPIAFSELVHALTKLKHVE